MAGHWFRSKVTGTHWVRENYGFIKKANLALLFWLSGKGKSWKRQIEKGSLAAVHSFQWFHTPKSALATLETGEGLFKEKSPLH